MRTTRLTAFASASSFFRSPVAIADRRRALRRSRPRIPRSACAGNIRASAKLMAKKSSSMRRRSAAGKTSSTSPRRSQWNSLDERRRRALRRDRPVGRHDRRSRDAHRLGAEAESRSRDVLGRQRLGRARKPHPLGRRERAARNSARRLPLLPRGWRARNAAAGGLQRRPRRRSTWWSRRRSCSSSTASRSRRAVGDSGLEVIGNANFPVFRDTKSGNYYLLTGDQRYTAAKLAGPWGTVAELAAGVREKFRRKASSHRSRPSSRRRRRQAPRRP